MKIEAITVCVGYGDFLAQTLPENLPVLDDLVVITSPDDEETRQVCRKHNVMHVLSDDYKRGGPFNKARMINRVIDQIGGHDWILHLDADIVLPRQFRRKLEWADIDERCIYGADRQNVVGWDAWQAFKKYVDSWNNHTHEMGFWWHPQYPVASRLVSSIHGYTPIGCFQLFHGSQIFQHNMHLRRYPIQHQDAARTDHQFSLQWDRKHRRLLPEVIVLHLESERGAYGANWCGRTTKRFGPEFKPNDDARWPKPKPRPEPHPHPEPPHPGPHPHPHPEPHPHPRPEPPRPHPHPPRPYC